MGDYDNFLRHRLLTTSSQDAVPKVIPHQAEACESAEAEPPHPSVDSLEDRQHHQVQREATTLAQDPSRYLSGSPPPNHPSLDSRFPITSSSYIDKPFPRRAITLGISHMAGTERPVF